MQWVTKPARDDVVRLHTALQASVNEQVAGKLDVLLWLLPKQRSLSLDIVEKGITYAAPRCWCR